MKICITTYGCQMNERDSDQMAVMLRGQGHALVSSESEADAIIVNTCSVRGKAEDKAIGKLRLLVSSRRTRPGLLVGATGCMVQRLGEELLRLVPGLDLAVGTGRLGELPRVLQQVIAGHRPRLDIGQPGYAGRAAGDVFFQNASAHKPSQVAARVNILFGCNRRCTYCIVPYVRGDEWSRPASEVLEEARLLVQNGTREITLLGQSIMAYGRVQSVWPAEYSSPRGFLEPLPRLLEALQALPGLERVRFTSGHPIGCSAELVRAIAELPAVCEHLHLPLQSGSDRILSLMKRGYSRAGYRATLARLRQAVPGMAITTDIIVGFPTETAADFAETMAALAEFKFDNAFIFKYNARPGTVAAGWQDDVSEHEKLRRNHLLLEAQNRICLGINRALVGQHQEVLIEGHSRRNAARYFGRTRGNKIVLLDARPGIRPGDLVRVRIEDAKIQTLYGRIEGDTLAG